MTMHWYIFVVLFLPSVTVVQQDEHMPPDAHFRHMIGFMANRYGEDSILELTILNPNSQLTYARITFLSDISFEYTFEQIDARIPPGNFENFLLPSTLASNTSVKCEKGVRIDTDQPTFVYGNNRQLDHTSMDGFLSIPRRALGNLHYVITGIKRPQILVVGLYANTSTNITLRTTSAASYQNRSYLCGQTIHETLQEYDTIMIDSETTHADFTGSEIRSSKPVSVYSGSRFSKSSHLTEQIPTVDMWGRHHVTVPPGDDFIHNVTIVAACPDTLVNFTCSDGSDEFITLLEAGSFRRMRPSNATCLISTTKPVLVAMEIYGPATDTSMTIIQPMRRLQGYLMFFVPAIVNDVNLMVVTYCNISLTLDVSPIGTTQVDGDSDICVGRTVINNGVHVIKSFEDTFFISGYMHGTQNYNSIAFPLVQYLDEREGNQTDERDTTLETISCGTKKVVTSRMNGSTELETSQKTPAPPMYASEATTTNTSRVRPHGGCRCVCSYTHRDINITLADMRKKLIIRKNMTNKHIRSLTSARDDRPSSKMIGLTASVICGVVVITILLLDSEHLIRMIRRIRRHILLR